MITRINFLEKKKILITYGTIALGLGGVFFFCLLLYGLLKLGDLRATKKIAALQADIDHLKKTRETMINQQTLIQGEGPYLVIQQALENSPAWSTILGSIVETLPPRVWLASLKSAGKSDDPLRREIIMNGQAKGAQVLALFLSNLEKNRHFEKVTLTTSGEESGGLFQFTIACDIGRNGWNLKQSPNRENKF